jgi:hypothetical protein
VVPRRANRALGLVGVLGSLLLTLVPGALAAPTDDRGASADKSQRVSVEIPSTDGTIRRVWLKDQDQGATEGVAHADVTPIQVTGPVGNRIDLVFVGDGYTRADLDTFHQHVQSKWEELAAVEPFLTYRELFNVWAVDVVSRDSGVDNDPTQGILRDTALDSTFFCAGVERLLCGSRGRAYSYASQAPAVDHVVLLANSTKYGGAGYTLGAMATASGGHPLSGQIVVHELGHSIGQLADEYEYGGPETYTGPEPREANVTTYTADVLAAEQLKWWIWLGEESPDGGVVGTYESAYYSLFGIYRPTENSLMRVLNSEFNLPGREAMIEQFYLLDPPLGSVGGARIRGNATVDLGLPDLVGADYDISWYVDGVEVAAWADQETVQLDLAGRHRLDARIVDTTPYVRDEQFRASNMTFRRSWNVS